MIRFMYDCEKCDRKGHCPDQKMVKKTENYIIKKKREMIDDIVHPSAMSVDIVCHCDNYQVLRNYRTVV